MGQHPPGQVASCILLTLSDSFLLDRIEQATDPGRSADLAAVIMQEGLAQVIIVLEVFM